MKIDSAVSSIADFLWDVLTTDQGQRAQKLQADPQAALAEAGHANVTSDELDAAISRISSRLPAESMDRMESIRAASCNLPSAGPSSAAVAPAQMAAAVAPAPAPVVQTKVVREVVHDTQVVNNTKLIREQPVTNNNVTNQTTEQNVTNNFVREGDNIVDNRTITEINARGDVTFDQKVSNDTVIATKGGVAANGDIEGSAINTGRNDGIMAGDDVELKDSVVGDGNTQISDSEVGAFSGKGDATNIEGKNVNTGSGDLTDVDTEGGDAQVVKGNGNDVKGDVDVDADGAEGPVNVAVGDKNGLKAGQDNSKNVEDSANTDNSVDGSGNTSVEGSANTSTRTNDVSETKVDDSGNTTTEDNDTTKVGVQQTAVDNSLSADNDTAEFDLQNSQVDRPVLEPEEDLAPVQQPAPGPSLIAVEADGTLPADGDAIPFVPTDDQGPELAQQPADGQLPNESPVLVDDPLTPQDESLPQLVDDPLTPEDESQPQLVDDPLTPEDESLGLVDDDGLLAVPADDPGLLGAEGDVDLDFDDAI